MGNDVLILTIYFLVVIYVLYQMAISAENALENRFKVDLDTDYLETQVNFQLAQLVKNPKNPSQKKITAKIDQLEIEEKGKKITTPPFLSLRVPSHREPDEELMVLVDVGPSGKMPRDRSIKSLSVSIQNVTNDAQVFIDWDRSSIAAGKARRTQRVIRSGVPITGGVPNAQLLSVVNPRETFYSQVTGENCLGVDTDTQTLQPKRALVEMMDIEEFIIDMMEMDQDLNRELNRELIDTEIEPDPVVVYGLRLMLGIRQITFEQNSVTTYLMLPFEFQATLIEDKIAFPPLRWLLDRPRPTNARSALGTLLLGRPKL